MERNNFDIVCCNAIYLKNNIKNPMYIKFMYTQVRFQELLSRNYVINSSVLAKKSVLIKSGMYPTSKYFYSYEDYFLWLKISLRHHIGFLDNDLLIYNDNPRFSARSNSLPLYKIRIRIFLFFIIFFFNKRINLTQFLTILKVYFINLIQLIFNFK
jgi:hypothetical protein